MRVLLLGRNGQVGHELQRSLADFGEVIALGSQPEGGLCGDLAQVDALRATIRELQPDVIVNAGAYTAVDKAESEAERADAINAIAPGVLAEEALRLGAWLVHYSTDYVFDGSGDQPRGEDAATGPLNVYGRTKLAGEQAIQAVGGKYLIFRTSWVYGRHGNNFAKTMLRLAQERDELKVIADQIGAPTGADLIADVTAAALHAVLQQPGLGGLYHLAAAGETSWHGYARFVLAQAAQAGWPLRVQAGQVQAIPTSAYPTPARRPHNSRLALDRLQRAFGLTLPAWQEGVSELVAGLAPPA